MWQLPTSQTRAACTSHWVPLGSLYSCQGFSLRSGYSWTDYRPIRVLGVYYKALGDASGPGCSLLLPSSFSLAMSASDVLRGLIKRDVKSAESHRTIHEFLYSPCYNYFSKTLKSQDVLCYVNFLDKASPWSFRRS